MTDLTRGLVYDRPSFTWVTPEQKAALDAEREERAFWRNRARQGELCTPMVIRDGMPAVQSMASGRFYESKSAIRAEYKRLGFAELGNDVDTTRSKQRESYMDREAKQRAIKATVGKAISAVDTMSDDTVKRRAWERAQKSVPV